MKPLIDFAECLRDTPKFRLQVEETENDIDQFEMKLEKVLKSCNSMIETGKTFTYQQSQFANSLWELSQSFHDEEITAFLNKLIHALQEMNKFHTILLDQASRTIVKDLSSFIKSDIKKVKEARHYFEKISGDLDIALNRNAQVPKNRPAEYEETSNILSATRSCFRHTALDYVHDLTILQAKKRHDIMSSLVNYMKACITFYHQGSDMGQDLDPLIKELSEKLMSMRNSTSRLEKEMENRHIQVNNRDIVPLHNTLSNKLQMEGYLFKRTSNAFKTWNRRWFCMKGNQLVYKKRTGDAEYTVMEEDVRLCTVKPVVVCDRRNCFEVLSPTKSHMLQADSEEMYLAWVSFMQHAIGFAIQRGPRGRDSNLNTLENHSQDGKGINRPRNKPRSRVWEQLLKIPGNDLCCDCGGANPRWASINLGITLCIECSGIHRSLGVHYSKVRSLTLDDWEPEILKVMAELGNTVINNVYEALPIDSETVRATPSCPGSVREAWIKAKYVERKFVQPLSAENSKQHAGREVSKFRTWSVRKLRRRPRSRDKHCRVRDKTATLSSVHETHLSTSSDGSNQPSLESLNSIDKNKADELESSEKRKSSNSDSKTDEGISDKSEEMDILLFGCDLPKPAIEGNLELSSDQDSTAGEEEDFADEEDMKNLHPDMLLYKAAAAHNLPVMCRALANGADKLWTNVNDKSQSALHQAIISGSVMSCEYLLLNGARINCQDANGKTPLYLSTELGHTAQVCLLLKHQADQHLEDENGVKPLDIAINQANADIVTLLRLGLLNEEMKDSDTGISGDETFNDVVRDFSFMACSHPERLQRRNDSGNFSNAPE